MLSYNFTSTNKFYEETVLEPDNNIYLRPIYPLTKNLKQELFKPCLLPLPKVMLSVSSHGVDPLSYFSFQPVLHDWCNKGCGMYYLVCGMVHTKEPLLLIGKSSPRGGTGFPLSRCVLSASLNKTFLSLSLNKYMTCLINLFRIGRD